MLVMLVELVLSKDLAIKSIIIIKITATEPVISLPTVLMADNAVPRFVSPVLGFCWFKKAYGSEGGE